MDNLVNDFLRETFQVLKCLQKSEKNEILLAVNNDDKQLYVIKFINGVNLPYKALKEISHPVLPKIIYVAETKNQTITVEEYINAKKISDIILEHGGLAEELALDITLQLCNGLEVLHKVGIVHRDIKPSNIFLTAEGKVKLIDFDAARTEKNSASADTRNLGTQGYAPPEQYGFAQTDNRSDIYALGITIKELLGDSYKGNLIKVLDKCTQLNPKDRYQSIIELKYALKNGVKLKYYKVLSAVAIVGIIAAGIIYLHVNHEYSQVQPQTQHSIENDKSEVIEALQKEGRGNWDGDKKIEESIMQIKKEEESTELKRTVDSEKNTTTSGELKISVRCAGLETKEWSKSLWVACPSWERWHKKRTGLYKEGFVYFPADMTVEFAIKNDTGNDIINPVLEFVSSWIVMNEIMPDIDGLVQRSEERLLYKKGTVFKTGEKMVGTLPLGRAQTNVGNPAPTLFVVFKADNYPRKYVTVMFEPQKEE